MGQRNLPVVIDTAAQPRRPEPRVTEALRHGAYVAQLLGQDGQKRGLRGGPPLLDRARCAYLGAEWTGPDDRRAPAGLYARARI